MTEPQLDTDVTIDSRGASCPGPLMDLIGKVKTLDPGAVVELQTSTRNSTTDVPEWLDEAGHELLEIEEHDDYWSIYLEVS
ncbi:sulfurtransferase TusA family protein [Salinilacihabitans rarus]|uniref:sulfurtransferase TusA family protein n=1 Tax=Salinilacihabitans rarus TaxID=2961596 RepID=UPI0020C89538|nr:sulfurtransferase TusA family protein [Salinilacihabitans rarus]